MANWKYKITNQVPWDHISRDENAENIWAILSRYGFTLEAACGIIGNMEAESYLNPGQKQLHTTTTSAGWGLIQWTPSTDLTDIIKPWYGGNGQMQLVLYEMDGTVSGRWIPTSAYPYTYDQFKALTDIGEATRAYFYERERGTWSDSRIDYANKWYELLGGQPVPPVPPVPPTPVGDYPYGGIRDVLRRLIIHA